jgi:hypothetical protein
MSSTPYLRHWIAVRDQVHALIALLPATEHCLPFGYEAEWSPEPVWAFSKKKAVDATGNRTANRPFHRAVWQLVVKQYR